ncbi:inward rectifier potassium channel Irk (plasmid) [Fulvitalea axinellae]|uniref:Inward rectifier potassium channel Irk n=1 Tax=Fulvitalea axinellae TaxID=1182444 RepID=A0AAU9CZS1_9BACT|nr:inward rectifier potassium channel Irk [Fulvitalea axinellae]
MRNRIRKIWKSEDFGFTKATDNQVNRFLKPGGQFNVVRKGGRFTVKDIYHWLMNARWGVFWTLAVGVIVMVNLLFSVIYFIIGVDKIEGAGEIGVSWAGDFATAIFFSFQTFTTVGYGALAPIGIPSNIVASLEAVLGLITFSLVTALIYAKFSKASVKLLFSDNILVSPHKKGKALMFRMVNERTDSLINMSVDVLVAETKLKDGKFGKKYDMLNLERSNIMFFPLNWTVVHVLDESSPLYETSCNGFKDSSLEFMIQVKCFDSTYSQDIYIHHSYVSEDIICDAKFELMYGANEKGVLEIDLTKLNAYSLVVDSEMTSV